MSVLGRAAAGAGVLTAMLVLASCAGDGQQGIPTDPPSTPTTTTTSPTPEPTTTVAPPPGPTVGDVPSNPQAATALRAFLVDLEAGGISAVAPTCWTVPPSEIPVRYTDVAAILDAAAQPGVATGDVVTWSGPVSTLSIDRPSIASGYACPRVFPTGTAPVLADIDAEYTVARYVGRFTGAPMNPDDLEGDFPLVCDGGTLWDPQSSGVPTPPPLAGNPGRLTGSASYNPDSVYVAFTNGDYKTVYVDVTDVSGFEQNRVVTLGLGPSGYCIGDIA